MEELALIGTEWLIIGGIVVLVLLFRPRTVTDLAHSIGRVASEFRQGSQGEKTFRDKKELLNETAEKMGIRTQGKTAVQLQDEILSKARKAAS